MRLIHRFTRDDISAWVWWPLAIGLTALCLLTIPGERRAVDRARFAVADGAVEVANRVLSPMLDRVGQVGQVSGALDDATAHAFRDAIRDQVMSDPRITVVRLWTPDGRMVWSSVARAPLGSTALNDAEVAEAASSPGRPVQFVTNETLDGRQGVPTLQTYIGLGEGDRSVAVAQFEAAPNDALVGPTQELWAGYRIVLGVAAGLVLILALLSLRAPVAPIGAGVPFFPESLPRGMAVLDARRMRELEEARAMARARLARIGARLQESERQRQHLVSEVQRILAAHGARPVSTAHGAPGDERPGRPSDVVVVPEAGAETSDGGAGNGSRSSDAGGAAEPPQPESRPSFGSTREPANGDARDSERPRGSGEPDRSPWR